MKDYHFAWLSVHPERSADWLAARLADGFHIHHVDGNHDNSHPDNLVLIDGVDHIMLHRGKRSPISKMFLSEEQVMERLREGQVLYDARVSGMTWAAAKLLVDIENDATALARAKKYADLYDLTWPPPVSPGGAGSNIKRRKK